MSTITNMSTADEALAALHEERFPVISPRLQSLTEAHAERTCPGWNSDDGCVNGGDEPDEDEEICFACVRAEDAFYRNEAQERDRRDAEVCGSQYRAQYLERRNELRAVRDQQVEMVKAIDAGKAAA